MGNLVYRTVIFSLLILLLSSCGGSEKPQNDHAGTGGSSAQQEKVPKDGKSVYTKNCALCHGNDGKKGTSGAKDLTVSTLSDAEKKKIITYGKGSMAGFGKRLSEEEIDKVVAYINTLP